MINFFALHETLFLIIAIFSAVFYMLSVHHIMMEGLPERFDRSNFDYFVIAVFYLTRVTLVISTLLLLTDLFLRS